MRLVLSRAKENASGGKWIELVEVEGGWVGGAAMGWENKERKRKERKSGWQMQKRTDAARLNPRLIINLPVLHVSVVRAKKCHKVFACPSISF